MTDCAIPVRSGCSWNRSRDHRFRRGPDRHRFDRGPGFVWFSAAPMRLFLLRIELANVTAVQGERHADARKHRRPAVRRDQDQEKASFTLSIAGCSRFLTFTQSGDRPARYGRSRRFDTKPLASPKRQATRNRSGPISPCSNGATKMPSRPPREQPHIS